MERLYKCDEIGNVRACEWVEGTDYNDNMVCMDSEYFDFLQEEHAYYRIEDFFYSLPKPLQLIVKPFFNKFVEKM